MGDYLAKPEHEIAYQDILNLMNKHKDKVNAIELLAIASNVVGKLTALQDQRQYTSAQVLEVVAKNVERGNAQILAGLMETKGSA